MLWSHNKRKSKCISAKLNVAQILYFSVNLFSQLPGAKTNWWWKSGGGQPQNLSTREHFLGLPLKSVGFQVIYSCLGKWHHVLHVLHVCVWLYKFSYIITMLVTILSSSSFQYIQSIIYCIPLCQLKTSRGIKTIHILLVVFFFHEVEMGLNISLFGYFLILWYNN